MVVKVFCHLEPGKTALDLFPHTLPSQVLPVPRVDLDKQGVTAIYLVLSHLHLGGHLGGPLPAGHLPQQGLRLAPGVHQGRVEAFEARSRETELDHLCWNGSHAGSPTKLKWKTLPILTF